MIPIQCEQGSEEWFEFRAGRPSASGFDRVVTTQGKASTQREKYLYQLAGEAITHKKEETFQSRAMAVGVEREAEARDLYELLYDVDVQQVGLCALNEKMEIVCSPDGMVGDDGLLEIKCPQIHTHVEYLLKDKLPTTYFQQVQGQLYVTEREYCDFMSYYPAMPTLIKRVKRDEKFIETLSDELDVFIKDLKEIINKIKGR